MWSRFLSWLFGTPIHGGAQFQLDGPFQGGIAFLGLALALGLAALFWWWRLGPLNRRALLVGLRTGTLGLTLFLLLDPVLLVHRFEPGQSFVLVLFDDSRSMQVSGPPARAAVSAWSPPGTNPSF